MKRLVINEFEKVSNHDINDLQKVVYQSIHDTVLYPFFQKKDGFIGTGFKPIRTGATGISVSAGSGFMWDSSQIGYDSKYREMILDSAAALTISAAHPALDRYDIVCVQPNISTATEQRYLKTGGTGPITLTSVDKVKTDSCLVQVVEGTPGLSPVVPATPSGWVKIAQVKIAAGVGIASASDLVDTRTILLPYVGGLIADRVVAPSGKGTDETLKTAIASLPNGGTIVVSEDLVLSSPAIVTNANIQIIAQPNVSISGSGNVGIQIQASGIRIRGLRMAGFLTAIQIDNGFNHCFITENRFSGCTEDIIDNNTTPNNVIGMNLSE